MTMNLAGLQSIEVLTPSKHNLQHCSCVLISRGFNQYASQIPDWSNSLLKKQNAFTPVNEILTTKGDFVHSLPKYQNQVTKENISSLRKQRLQ